MSNTMTEETRVRLPPEYGPLLEGLKERIRVAQLRAATSVNQELVHLYWAMRKRILAAQASQGWGARVIERLSNDLRREFPGMKGFSRTNLLYMRAFAEAWPDEAIVQQVVGRIPWGHNLRLIEAIDDPRARLWYAEQAVWNRSSASHPPDGTRFAPAGESGSAAPPGRMGTGAGIRGLRPLRGLTHG